MKSKNKHGASMRIGNQTGPPIYNDPLFLTGGLPLQGLHLIRVHQYSRKFDPDSFRNA